MTMLQSVDDHMLRTEKGLSQEALAAKMRALGLTTWRQTTVAKVESASGPRTLSLQEVVGLAVALGLTTLDRFLSADLEAGMFAHAMEQRRAEMATMMERWLGSEVWDQLELTPEQQATVDSFRSSSEPLEILNRSIDDLTRRKVSVAKDSRRDWRAVIAEQLMDGDGQP
jgi:transcriptional regulator with XRE-family HTH domain